MFYSLLVYFAVILYILWSVYFVVVWHILSPFVIYFPVNCVLSRKIWQLWFTYIGTDQALLVKALELLARVEEPLIVDVGRVAQQPQEEVAEGGREAGVGPRGEQGPSADVVQVQVRQVHHWRELKPLH
jgi:hypothetical protein